jgi:hypothetical protein
MTVRGPKDLVARIDRELGPRRRSEFVAEPLREKFDRCGLLETMEAAIGSLADLDVPGWETPESTRAWARAQRRGGALPAAAEE